MEFLCELSSCVMFDSCLRTATKSDLFMLPVEKENGVLYRDELGQVLQKAKQVVRSSYELTRRRATELSSSGIWSKRLSSYNAGNEKCNRSCPQILQ